MIRLARNATKAAVVSLLAVLALISGCMWSAPPITASFLDPGAFIHGIYPGRRRLTEADVRAKIDAMDELGIETISSTYVEYISNTWGAFYPSLCSAAELARSAAAICYTILSGFPTTDGHG